MFSLIAVWRSLAFGRFDPGAHRPQQKASMPYSLSVLKQEPSCHHQTRLQQFAGQCLNVHTSGTHHRVSNFRQVKASVQPVQSSVNMALFAWKEKVLLRTDRLTKVQCRANW
jgi:hypothetical protein